MQNSEFGIGLTWEVCRSAFGAMQNAKCKMQNECGMRSAECGMYTEFQKNGAPRVKRSVSLYKPKLKNSANFAFCTLHSALQNNTPVLFCSRPEHSRRLRLGDNNALEERNRLLETFLAGHVAVLVLDGHYVVVADNLKCGYHFLPRLKA